MKSRLLVPKDAFRAALLLRIAEGQSILNTFNSEEGKKQEAFEKLEKAFRIWNSYNKTWIEQSFSEAPSEYYQGYLDANTSSLEEMIAIMQGGASASLQYRIRFFRDLVAPKIEYLEDLLSRLDLIARPPQPPPSPQAPIQFRTQPQAMNSEEIIKKQAKDAVTAAERYGIHNHQGKYVGTLREQSLKLYQPSAKATYFQEAIRLVEEKVAAHRAVCKEGPGCPKEKKYEEAIFFLHQELDILPKPIVNPAPPHQSAPSTHSLSAVSMDKRYQVFISSTFADLQHERLKVQQAVMELDCIPAGMEAFPAIDEEQFDFIKRVIDDCDYYLLIIGGRYGSVSSTGVSYTEMEYDYAISKGIKAVVLLHKEPGTLPLNKSELSQVSQKKLEAFRKKVAKDRLVRFWSNADELPGLVASSLAKTIKTYPAVGWVRASSLPSALIPEEHLRKNAPPTGPAPTSAPRPSLADLHPVIQSAAGKLFTDGHYRQALLDAYIAVDDAVRQKSRLTGNGTRLMEVAFSPNNPVLKIGDSSDEQQGFMALFRGAMLAVRNPKAHSLGGTSDIQRALEWLYFASVLLRNLDDAALQQPNASNQ